jgi:hypothetical protein
MEFAPALAEMVSLAIADADRVNPNGCCSQVKISVPSEIRTTADAREIVRDWVLMLGDLAGSKDASLSLSAIQRDSWVEVRLVLVEATSTGEPVKQYATNLVPNQASIGLFEMGGEFRVSSSYPETSVWIKLPVAA